MLAQNDTTFRSTNRGMARNTQPKKPDVVLQIIPPKEDDVQFLHPPGPDHFLNRRATPSSRSMFLLRCFVIFLVYLAGFYLFKQLLLQPPVSRTLTKGESWVLQPNAYLFWQLHFFGTTITR